MRLLFGIVEMVTVLNAHETAKGVRKVYAHLATALEEVHPTPSR